MSATSRRLRALTAHVSSSSPGEQLPADPGTSPRLLVANRGEIAIRICRAAAHLGIPTVGVYSTDDAPCLHTRAANVAVELVGAGRGAAAYLNQEALLAVAAEHSCTMVHCGYGQSWVGTRHRGGQRRASGASAGSGTALVLP